MALSGPKFLKTSHQLDGNRQESHDAQKNDFEPMGAQEDVFGHDRTNWAGDQVNEEEHFEEVEAPFCDGEGVKVPGQKDLKKFDYHQKAREDAADLQVEFDLLAGVAIERGGEESKDGSEKQG